MEMSGVVAITVKNVYGEDKFYPHNDQARGLAAIAGTKTLTRGVLRVAQDMGFTIRVDQADISIFAIDLTG
jgi:hypothetical protein